MVRKRQIPPARKPADKDPDSGVIRASECYTLAALKRRLKLTDSAWWELAKRGLPQKQVGKRKLILGRAVLEFLETLPDVEVPAH